MSATKHLIFVNESIHLDPNLIETSLDGSEVWTLNSQADGLLQIEAITSKYSNIDSIQIVSHGGDGKLELGDITLSDDNLSTYSEVLGSIGESLSQSGDVLLYGCNVASTENGKGFVLGLSKKLAAEVGASIDLSGSVDLGGDSDLEFKTGKIETKTIDLDAAFVEASTVLASIASMGADALKANSTGGTKVTYLEMRNILETAAKSGITAQEFSDLKTIYKNSEGSFENNWVKYISHSTINGHSANKYWTGGVKLKSQIETMGNMTSGSTELHANRLIAKWFKGEDLPMPISGGDTANPNAAAAAPGYIWTTGPLFKADITTTASTVNSTGQVIAYDASAKNGKIPANNKSSGGMDSSSYTPGVLVTADDVNQGSAGTCYFMACLGAVAHQQSPDMKVYSGDAAKAGKLIEGMFVDPFAVNDTSHADKGKIFGMQFFNNSGQEVWTTVNTQLPASSQKFGWNNTGLREQLRYAGNKEAFKVYDQKKYYSWGGSAKDPAGEIWVGLVEKGYVQVTNQVISWRSNPEKYPMSWAATEGGDGWSFKHLQPTQYTRYSGHEGFTKYGYIKNINEDAVEAAFIQQMKAGGMAAIGSWNSTAYNPATGKTMWNEYDGATGKFKWYSPDGSGGKIYDSNTGGVGKYDIPAGTQKQIYASHMHMLLDYDASTKKYLVKNPHTGFEYSGKNAEWWASMDDLTSKYINSDIWITDPVASPKTYKYTVTSNAGKGLADGANYTTNSSKAKAVNEGDKVTFTITRDDSGSESVVYIYTLNKSDSTDPVKITYDMTTPGDNSDDVTTTLTADKNDFAAMTDVQQLKFSANEKVKTIVIQTHKDASAEGSGSGLEVFALGLVKNITSSAPDAIAEAWIKDVTPKDYKYEVLSNSGTTDTAIKEGGKITFTINRPLLGSDEASTVYLTTNNGTTTNNDYATLNKQKLEFTKFETSKKVYIKTYKDAADDTGEYFSLRLYKGLDNSGNVTDAKHEAKGYIKDEAAPNYSYTVTSDAGDKNKAKTEGEDVTFFITRSNQGSESTVYLSTIDNTAIGEVDYVPVTGQALVFKANQKKLSYVVKTKADANLENTEAFDLGVYNSVKDKVPLTTGSGYLKDGVFLPDYYELKQDGIYSSVVNALAADQKVGSNKTVSDKGSSAMTTALDGGKFVSITSVKDESVKFTVTGKDKDGGNLTEDIVAKKGIVYGIKAFKSITSIKTDKATTENVSVGVFDGVNEGKAVTFTVTRDNKYSKADSVFISTSNATAKDGDFEALNKFEIKFKSFQDSKTFTIQTNSDSETDDNEYFSIDLYMDANSDQSYAHQKVYINDVPKPTTHTYTITNPSADNNNAITSTPILEGEDAVFTIKRATSGGTKTESTVYVKTMQGKASGDDFIELAVTPITFAAKEDIKTVTVKTKSDKISKDASGKAIDDNEDFVLLLFTSAEDTKEISKYETYNKAYIKDVAAAKDYKYTVTSDSSYKNPIEENGVITFTINRLETNGAEGKGTVSTIYISTTENSAGEKDYTAIKSEALKFESHQSTKIVKVQTTADTITEGRESFYFDLFDTLEDANNGNFKSYTQGYIKDSAASKKATYTYEISSAHSDKGDNSKWVTEGQAATFTVKRIKDANSGDDVESMVYIKTNDGTAFAGSDFQALDGYTLKFNPSENNIEKEFTVTTNTDTVSDDGENFFVSLFKSKADYESGDEIAAYQTAYIKNDSSGADSVANYSYAVTTANDAQGKAIEEGKDLTFTITRTLAGGKSASKSSVFVSTTLGSADENDIDVIKNKKITFKKDENVKTVTVKTKLDTVTESTPEYFWFDLFKTKAAAKTGDYDKYVTAYIKDDTTANKAVANYTYAVSSANGSTDKAASEGDKLTFTITRTFTGSDSNDKSASTIYVSTTDASAVGGEDFEKIQIKEIKFKKDQTEHVETVEANFDKATEGTEYFYFDIFKTKADAEDGNFHKYGTGYIKDNTSAADALNDYTYSIESLNAGANLAYDASKAVKEGEEAVFIIKRALKSGKDAVKDAKEGTVYVETATSTAKSGDFEALEMTAVKFKSGELEKTVKVKAFVDEKTESQEKFILNLYKTKADAKEGKIDQYGMAYIKDDSSAADAYNYTYAISSSTANAGAAVKEGEDIKFTITRSKINGGKDDAASTVFVSTTESSATNTDYKALDKFKVSFNPSETSKEIIVNTKVDNKTESTESFFFDLFTTMAKAKEGDYVTYKTGYIKDDADAAAAIDNYTYAVTTANGSSNPAEEGSDLTFTITRTLIGGKTAAASKLYIKTTEASATNLDYVPIDENHSLFELDFAKDDTVKTIKVQSKLDDVKGESNESFYLDLFLNKGDAEAGDYHKYATGYIKNKDNVAADIYKYEIEEQLQPVEEGTDVIFIVTRSLINQNDAGKGTSSTVYWKTTSGNADETDYDKVDLAKIEFLDKNDNKKEIKVSTKKDKDNNEGVETFAIELYKTLADAEEDNYHTYQKAQIKDPAIVDNAVYTYAITSNSPSNSAKEEGSEVEATITRTLVSGTEGDSTIYLNTTPGSATKEDFEFITKKALNFTKSDKEEKVTIKLTQDSLSEQKESFYLDLFETKADAENGSWGKVLQLSNGTKVWTSAYIKNKTNEAESVTYTVTTDSTKSSAKKEGEVVTVDIKNPAQTPSTIYATAAGGTAQATDYFIDPGEGGTVTIKGKTFYEITWKGGDAALKQGKVALVTDKDPSETGKADEYFYIQLFKSKADAENGKVYEQAPVYIQDVENKYTYAVTEHQVSDAIVEGQDITFEVTRSGTGPTNTVLYAVSFDDGAKATEDYDAIQITELVFTSNSKKTITIKTKSDSDAESPEKILVGLYESYDAAKAANSKGALSTSDEGYVTKGHVYVKDAPGSYTYEFSSNKSTYKEGEDVVFTITRSDTGTESTMHVSTWNVSNSSYTTPGTDHAKLDHQAIIFAANDKTKTVTLKPTDDGVSESEEILWIIASKTKGVNDWNGSWQNKVTGMAVKVNDKTSSSGLAESKFSVEGDVYGHGGSNYGGSSGDDTITITSATKNNIPGKSNNMFFNDYAFAAKTASSEVITWGNSTMGGDSSGVADKLKNVSSIFSNSQAFAVLKSDGSVVTWGNSNAGGDSSSVASDLNGTDDNKDVTKIASTQNSFAALRKDGSVITWGAKSTGGEGTKNLADTIASGVKDLYSNMSAFAAVKTDGTVATWGYSTFGGDSTSVANKISNKSHADFLTTTDISSTGSAFAAIRSDGSVITWGNASDGGDSSSVASLIDGGDKDPHSEDVVQIYATTSAFAALRKNGSVITWGDNNNGGSTADVEASLNGTIDVVEIFSTNNAFAALRSDGSVITWGDKDKGGDSSSVASDLNGTVDVTKVYATTAAFAALRTDGKVITWGYGSYGGDSSGVAALIDGTLDDNVISVDAAVKAGKTFALVGSKTISFTNAQSVVITSAGDDTGVTFTVQGTDKDGNSLTGTIKGAKNGSAIVQKDDGSGGKVTAYFKTVVSITADSDTAGNVKAGVTDKTVQTIISTDKAFAAMRADGSVVAWGDNSGGGNSAAVNDTLILGDPNPSKVTQLYASSAAFSAVKDNGSVVAWGDTDRGGSTAGVDFSKAGEVKGMSGESSGVDCTVQCWKDAAKKISTADLKFYKDGTGSAVSGDFKTDGSGKISITGLSGKYTAGYKAATDSTTTANVKKAVNIDDIMLILKDIGKVSALSNNAKVAGDINSDSKVNIDDVMEILKMIGSVKKHSDLGDQFVIRDSQASDPFTSPTFDVGGGSLTLNSFLLGDVDGSYWT